MHKVLVNRLGGLSLPRKSVVRLTDRPDMTLDVYRGRKTTMQQCINTLKKKSNFLFLLCFKIAVIQFISAGSRQDKNAFFSLPFCVKLDASSVLTG